MRPLALALAVVLLAAPAAAEEPSGAEEAVPLEQLIAEVEEEIDFYEAAFGSSDPRLPLSRIDLAARVSARRVRADEFIGSVRFRAHDTLHALLPADVVHSIEDFDGFADAAAISDVLEGSGIPSTSVWAAESIVAEWITLESAVDRLRALTGPGSPERVCPVDGDTHFDDDWNVSRPWGRIHKGVDLHAERGTPLVAIEDGVVIQANWHYLGGRQVYLKADSTGDVYYYAHLDYWPKWLWTGTRLEAGDHLGLAGSSGNAHTPHLHLGWMPGSEVVDLDNLQNAYPLMYELCS